MAKPTRRNRKRAAPAPRSLTATAKRDAHGYDPDAYDWVPVPRAYRADGWTPERQRAFIGYLADTGSVATAVNNTGMSASSAYRLRRSTDGQAFAAAWDAAIQQAANALVDAAFERAVNGSEEPVWDKNGRVIGRRFRQSDAMMMFLLRKHFPERYGDLHRDRLPPGIGAVALAPPPPPVAETLAVLGPATPADPAALMAPDALADALARADLGEPLAGLDPAEEPEYEGLGPDFEEALAMAKRAAAEPGRYVDVDDDDDDPDTA